VGVPPAAGKRRVSLTLTLAPRQRGADPDAYRKSLLDALTHAGMLLDDNRQGVELGPVQFIRGEHKATAILLEDVPSCDP
jgi:Holliday junction resolvase RusA-like endonuclease